jgi:hypothetical protein
MRFVTKLAVIGLVAGACGGGSEADPTTSADPAPASTAGASTTQAPPSSTTTTAVPVTTQTPPSTTTTSPPETEAPNEEPGEFAVFDQAPTGTNWMQVSLRTGAVLNEQPELCLILQEGEFGKIEAFNIALNWSEGEWTLIWNSIDGRYDGPVTGSVDGQTVTFEGEANGLAVRGSITCVEA